MIEVLKAKIFYFLYNVVWFFIAIPFLLMLLWRYRHSAQHRSHFLQRLSIYQKTSKSFPVWVHVASVGEALGCMPLLTALRKKYGDEQLLVTTTTPTGASVIRQHLGANVCYVYLPFDLSFFMRRFLEIINPRVLLVFETEVWPAMVNSCHEKNINVLLINARMSEKSKKRYGYLSNFSRQVFSKITLVAAQSSSDASRLQSLGANNVIVTGNIKSDVTLNETLINSSKKLQLSWKNSSYKKDNARKILLAASTHRGEEEIVLKAYLDIKKYYPETLLVLAPRHSDRFNQVWSLCVNEGFNVVKRSGGDVVSAETDVVLVDTMGELLMLLGVGDVAIMGGTFIDHGGHNFLEPAVWGIPIVSGMSHYNFSGVAQDLLNIGALTQVETPQALSENIRELLGSDAMRMQKGEAAKQYMQEKKGSLAKLLSTIDPYLDA